MSARRWPLTVAACLALVATLGCTVGPTIATYPPALSREGIHVDIRTQGETVRGELIDVRDSALVVLMTGDLVLVGLPLIRDLRFIQQGATPRRGEWLTADDIATLRRISRFPQGMTPGIEQRFLAELTRPALRVIVR